MLQWLKKYGINIKTSESQLFKREFSYFEPVISAGDYTVNPKNVNAVSGLLKKKPNNITEQRNQLGLIGYF